MEEKIRLLFVCTGNICRSPTAEVVMRSMAKQRGLSHRIEVASAGTQAYHVGEGADRRSVSHAARRGYDLSAHQARKFVSSDVHDFDYILCMDRSHLEVVKEASVPFQRAQVELFLKFAARGPAQDMPDPYYGGDRGFENVLDLCEAGSQGMIEHLLQAELDESSRRG